MRSLMLIAAASLVLSGCGAMTNAAAGIAGLPASPAAVCDRSTMDESGGQLVELGYRLFRTAGELGVDTGVIKGARATQVRKLDMTLFTATVAVQTAYKTCNAGDYAAAIVYAKSLLAQGDAVLSKKGEQP